MKTIVFGTVFGLVGLFTLGYLLNQALAMPDVHFSYKTQQCVEVINYTDEGFHCGFLPRKYNHVWVE